MDTGNSPYSARRGTHECRRPSLKSLWASRLPLFGVLTGSDGTLVARRFATETRAEMGGFMGAAVAPIYVVGTFDTKAEEACFIAEALRAEGVAAVLVDVGTLNPPLAEPCIERSKVAAYHPKGPEAVLG